MVSVEKWKSHFKKLAHKAYPHEDMYVVNQTGRGLGRNSYSKTQYKVRPMKDSSGPNPSVQIVSPVAQAVEQARALVKTEPIKRKKAKAGATKSAKHSKGKVSKKKKEKKKKTHKGKAAKKSKKKPVKK